MAAPVITVTRTPEGVVAPGTQVTFTVTAVDSDARSVTYSFTGTDSTGAAANVSHSIVVSDEVTIDATVDDPNGEATLSPDVSLTNVWHSTV